MTDAKLRLFHFRVSSCSWRVRWVLAIKNLACELHHIDLFAGEQKREEFLKLNPMGNVPVLEIMGKTSQFIGESLPIIEWLEEAFPEPSIFPADPILRARCRQLAELINSGTQPLQNLRVMSHYSPVPEEQVKWNQHWIHYGLSAFEKLVKPTAGRFSCGDTVSLADICLIPQCYNATKRYQMSLDEFPTISKIFANALQLEQCMSVRPEVYS